MELFTDRVSEQDTLRAVLKPCSPDQGNQKHLVTSFYGVGGVGKTTLCNRALEIAEQEYKNQLVCVHASFDDKAWKPSTSFAAVAIATCNVLESRKISTELTSALVLLWRSSGGDKVDRANAWQLALDAVDKGGELLGVPGVAIVFKGAVYLRSRAKQKAIRERLRKLSLWPSEVGGRLTQCEIEKYLPGALFRDIMDWLEADESRHLRIFLDGFECIQSRENSQDAQKKLVDIVGYFASEWPGQGSRLRFIIFGREKLHWDELYRDDAWNLYWNQHLLGGLSERDARDFLAKAARYQSSNGQPAIAGLITKMQDEILDAADEASDTGRCFYPYSLDIAVDMIVRSGGQQPVDLGQTPADLQQRFLRYLGDQEKRALMILAIAERFDEELFDWLAEKLIVKYPRHSLYSELVHGHSYFQPIEANPGWWRFHRQMEYELCRCWRDVKYGKEGVQIVHRLLDYFSGIIGAKPEMEWGIKEVNAWNCGMEIIVTQGPESGLLEVSEWKALLAMQPWVKKPYQSIPQMISYTRRLAEGYKKRVGSENPETLSILNDFADLLNSSGDYNEAEKIYARILVECEKARGSDDPCTLRATHGLATLLHEKGEYKKAEPLYGRALAGREKKSGPDHAETLKTANNLGDLLNSMGDHQGAASMHRRVWAAREKTLGASHTDTLSSLNNLASALSSGSERAEEALFIRAFDGLNKQLGPEHPSTLMCLNNLSIVMKSKNDFVAAEDYCRRALAGRIKILGPGHPDTLASMRCLADIMMNKPEPDHKEAERFYRSALDGMEIELAPDHREVLAVVNGLARLLTHKGDYSEAGKLFRRLYEGRCKIYGCDNLETLSAGMNLGVILYYQGNCDEADMYFRSTLAGREKLLGVENTLSLEALKALISLLEARGDMSGLLLLLKESYIRSKVYASEIRYKLACLECAAGNLEVAKELIREELALDPGKKERALDDEGLSPIHDYIRSL